MVWSYKRKLKIFNSYLYLHFRNDLTTLPHGLVYIKALSELSLRWITLYICILINIYIYILYMLKKSYSILTNKNRKSKILSSKFKFIWFKIASASCHADLALHVNFPTYVFILNCTFFLAARKCSWSMLIICLLNSNENIRIGTNLGIL